MPSLAGLSGWSGRSILLALVVLILFNIAFTPHFVSLQTLNVNLTQVCTIVIVATGLSLVIATGGIDLSVGSLMAISGALAPAFFAGHHFEGLPGLGIALAFMVPPLVAMACGAFNGALVAKVGLQPIIATLVLYIAGRGIAQVMTNGNLVSFSSPSFQVIGLGRVAGIPVQVILAVLIVLIVVWMLRRTTLGRYILAVGGNETAARLAGVPIVRVKLFVYALSGLLAGLAGLVVIAINSSADANRIGLGMELDAIAAVAVGGTPMNGGRAFVVGTLLGALLIQLVRYTLLANGVPDAVAMIAKAAIIIVAVYIQAQRAA
jgi:simple sugar transport system permease protein/ribose transport system permease protein